VSTIGARCAMRARQATHFVNDLVIRSVADFRNLCTRGAAGREFDLMRCKATLTELRVLLTPSHLPTWLLAYATLGSGVLGIDAVAALSGGLIFVICGALIAFFSSPT